MNQIIKKSAIFILCWILLTLITLPAGATIIAALRNEPSKIFINNLLSFNFLDVLGSYSAYLTFLQVYPTGNQIMGLWALVILAGTGFIAIYKYFVTPKQIVKDSMLGNSVIISESKEIMKKNDFWSGKDKPESSGLVLSANKKGYIYDSSVPHALIVGKTGAGKSQFITLPTLHLCMANSDNILVSGKPELLELTGDKAISLGYDVFVLDFNGYPGASRFNPMDLVVTYFEQGDIEQAQQAARELSKDLIELKPSDPNPFFRTSARNLCQALILIVASADIPRNQKNMASVLHLLNVGTSGNDPKDPSLPLKQFIKNLGVEHPAYEAAGDFLGDGASTVAGKNVLSNLKTELGIFSDKNIQKLTSKSDISIDELINNKTITYIHLLEEGHPYLPLFTIFFNQFWRVAQQAAYKNGGRLPRKTSWIADEIFNLPAISAIPEIVVLGRSMKLHLYAFAQNLSQLKKYRLDGDSDGEAGRNKLLGSMGIKVALSLGTTEDFHYFSELVGKHAIRTHNYSSQNQSVIFNNTSQSFNEMATDLIPEFQWQHFTPIKDGAIICKAAENSKPGRSGIFKMPLTYASNTPAGKFFGLGDEEYEVVKKHQFRMCREAEFKSLSYSYSIWDVDLRSNTEKKKAAYANNEVLDEFSIWDE